MSEIKQSKAKAIGPILILMLIFSISLFLSAGRINWRMGWILILIMAGSHLISVLFLLSKNPELLQERSNTGGKRDLDRVLAGIMAFYGPIAFFIVGGLSARYSWQPEISYFLQVCGVLLACIGSAISIWAMISNSHFYGVYRIEREKGHKVCHNGPYHVIRHPGYLGAILFDLAVPMVLNAVWAYIPVLITIIAIIIRTGMEDRSLQNELDGYNDYSKLVGHRLLPFVW